MFQGASSKKKMIKDVFSGSGKGYGDDLDLLESATVGAGTGSTLESLGGKYVSSASAGAGMSRSAGGGGAGLLPSSKSFEVRKSGAGGGTIVKAEFQDMFFRQDAPDGEANNLNLAKV